MNSVSTSPSSSEVSHPEVNVKPIPVIVTKPEPTPEVVVPVISAIAASGALVQNTSFWSKRKIVIGVIVGIVVFLFYKYRNKIIAFFNEKTGRSGSSQRKRLAESYKDTQEQPEDTDQFNSSKKQRIEEDQTSIHDQNEGEHNEGHAEEEHEVEPSGEDSQDEDVFLTEAQMSAIAEEANHLCGDASLLPNLAQVAEAMNSEQSNEMYMPFIGISIGETPNLPSEHHDHNSTKIVELNEGTEEAEQAEEENAQADLHSTSTFAYPQEKFGKRSRKRQ